MTEVQTLPAVVCALVGMSALAVAVVGGPLTMAFLALESTGSLPMTIAVLAASVVSALRFAAPSATPSRPGGSTCAARRSAARWMSAGCAV